MTHTARRLATTLLGATLLLSGACSDSTGPDTASSVAGEWQGSVAHPNYDGGSLRLTVAQAGEVLSGEYRMTLTRGNRENGRVHVEQSGGPVTGGLSGSTVSIVLTRSDGNWIGTGTRRGNVIDGQFHFPNGRTAPFRLER